MPFPAERPSVGGPGPERLSAGFGAGLRVDAARTVMGRAPSCDGSGLRSGVVGLWGEEPSNGVCVGIGQHAGWEAALSKARRSPSAQCVLGSGWVRPPF